MGRERSARSRHMLDSLSELDPTTRCIWTSISGGRLEMRSLNYQATNFPKIVALLKATQVGGFRVHAMEKQT